jgi:hypothetical protein
MTTPQAAARYEAEHHFANRGRGVAVYNPHSKPEADLPVIYGFNNGGSVGWLQGVLIAEDGTPLGGHVCSSEGYMPHDLGILEDTRPDLHEEFRAHYPNGYRMSFVGHAVVAKHAALLRAIELCNAQPDAT